MSRVFDKKTHKFINPNRIRVRFYSKLFRKYYTVWIRNGLILTKKGGGIMMTEVLYKQRFKKKKEITSIQPLESNFEWKIECNFKEEKDE